MKNSIASLSAAVIAAVLLAPRAAHAAEDGQLWEVTNKMDMPDMPRMPAGMGPGGARTLKICRSGDMRKDAPKHAQGKECTVDDVAETGTKVHVAMTCKEGKVTMDYTFNKGRTEYTGVMHMTGGKHGDMTMTISGKKIGTCDASKDSPAAKAEKYKAQAEASNNQYKAMTQQAEATQIANCGKAVEKMDPDGLGIYGYCRKGGDASCKSLIENSAKQQPKVNAACTAKADEFCKRFQTHAGYLAASRSGRADGAARVCGASADGVRAQLCGSAQKAEAWEFIGASCPDLAKPLAKAHCAGRSYTVKEGDPRAPEKKWYKFCSAVAGAYASGDEEPAPAKASSPAADADAKSAAKEAAKSAAKDAGVKMLKGLFGR